MDEGDEEAREAPQSGDGERGFGEGRSTPARDWRWVGAPQGAEGKEGLVRSRKLVRESAEGWWGAESSDREWAVGNGFRGPAEPGEPARWGRDGFPAGRASRAGARRPGLEQRSRAPPTPPASRGPALPAPAGASSSGARGLSPARWPQRRPPPPSRSPDPSSARRPGRGRARGIIAIAAAASAHPGSRRAGGRRSAVTETPGAPPPPPDTQAAVPACPPRPQRLAGPRGWPLPPPRPPPPHAAPLPGLGSPRGDLGSEAGESWRAEQEGACGLGRRPGTLGSPPPPRWS